MIDITPWVAIVGALTPFLTAIAAKLNTPDWWKGLLSFSWAAIAGVISGFVDNPSDAFEWGEAVSDGAGVWATHLLTWLGLTSEAVRRLHESTSSIGLKNPFGSD